jgi:hypothetical protein
MKFKDALITETEFMYDGKPRANDLQHSPCEPQASSAPRMRARKRGIDLGWVRLRVQHLLFRLARPNPSKRIAVFVLILDAAGYEMLPHLRRGKLLSLRQEIARRLAARFVCRGVPQDSAGGILLIHGSATVERETLARLLRDFRGDRP